MKKTLGSLLLLFVSLFSTVFADDFQKNLELIDKLKNNNVRLIVLCNFQGTNNVLDIVTSSHSPGYALTNYGLAVLQDTIPLLSAENISHIYTTPAFRAQQSANLLGAAFNLTPEQLSLDPLLGMQGFGDGEGEDYDVYKQRFTSEEDMLTNTPSNGESGLSVFNRAQNFLLSLENLQNQTVLIITHAFNFCHISKCLTGKFGHISRPGTFVIYDFNAADSSES